MANDGNFFLEFLSSFDKENMTDKEKELLKRLSEGNPKDPISMEDLQLLQEIQEEEEQKKREEESE